LFRRGADIPLHRAGQVPSADSRLAHDQYRTATRAKDRVTAAVTIGSINRGDAAMFRRFPKPETLAQLLLTLAQLAVAFLRVVAILFGPGGPGGDG
jgi:hypothetical protein